MNSELIKSFLSGLGATFSSEDAERILRRNTRFLPEFLKDDYFSIVLLEIAETSIEELSAESLQRICNRVSRRLIRDVKRRETRFVQTEEINELAHTSSQDILQVKDILHQLTMEEQTYLLMRMDDYTFAEIAEHFHLPTSTVHYTWKKIVNKVKKILD